MNRYDKKSCKKKICIDRENKVKKTIDRNDLIKIIYDFEAISRNKEN